MHDRWQFKVVIWGPPATSRVWQAKVHLVNIPKHCHFFPQTKLHLNFFTTHFSLQKGNFFHLAKYAFSYIQSQIIHMCHTFCAYATFERSHFWIREMRNSNFSHRKPDEINQRIHFLNVLINLLGSFFLLSWPSGTMWGVHLSTSGPPSHRGWEEKKLWLRKRRPARWKLCLHNLLWPLWQPFWS